MSIFVKALKCEHGKKGKCEDCLKVNRLKDLEVQNDLLERQLGLGPYKEKEWDVEDALKAEEALPQLTVEEARKTINYHSQGYGHAGSRDDCLECRKLREADVHYCSKIKGAKPAICISCECCSPDTGIKGWS